MKKKIPPLNERPFWCQKVSSVVALSYVVSTIFSIMALYGRFEWVRDDNPRWIGGTGIYIYSALIIIYLGVGSFINMKKLIAAGKCTHMVRDCVIVAVPLSLAVLSLILDLILIK